MTNAGRAFSRRAFLATGITATALAPSVLSAARLSADEATASYSPSKLLDVNFRALISRGDLVYDTPVSRSEEGLPVGNGRMGSLVWTTPSAIKLQINRPDVFAENRDTHSFPERNADYGSGCGYVDINLVDFGDDVFSGSQFRQKLELYDAVQTVSGNGVTARVAAWHQRDVIAIEVDDARGDAAPVSVDLRMLRYAVEYIAGRNFELASQNIVQVTNRNQTAASRLEIRDGRTVLTQAYREGSYYCSSAVAIEITDRSSRAKLVSDSAVRLSAAPGKGRFTIWIGSAASFDPTQDVAALALAELDAAAPDGFAALLGSNREWWHKYWSRAFVQLHSADGKADFVEQHYSYFLYIMASSSRAAYPPRFGGMLWFTNGDMREWGAQHWWANAACYYDGFPPANRLELIDPVFSMYSKAYDSWALAARQQWGSQGIFIPETTWFDGLEDMPEDLATEMRDLYLFRKPWEERSANFQQVADTKLGHNSRWNWKDNGKWVEGRLVYRDKGAGPCGQVNHIFSSGAKIAYLYWLRYEYSLDAEWLRGRAYPMVKGIAEFYRNFSNVQKDDGGKYHIHNVNNHEPVWCARDTMEELSAMRGLLPVAIRASEILGVDADLRAKWREVLANLTDLPSNTSQGALEAQRPGQPRVWIAGLPPSHKGNLGALSTLPALVYDLCTVETDDAEMVRVTSASYDASPIHPINEKTPVSVLNRISAVAARLGRGEDLRHTFPNQLQCLDPERDFCDWAGGGKTGALRNRMTLREGPGAIGVERIGRMTEGLHLALMQSAPPGPGREPVIHVFPAWPKGWDAQYTLLARGGFLVTSSCEQDKIGFVELLSQLGGDCRLRNPWGEAKVTLFRNGKKAESLAGLNLKFATVKDEHVVVLPAGAEPDQFRRSI